MEKTAPTTPPPRRSHPHDRDGGPADVGHAFTYNQVVQVLEPYLDPRFNAEPDRHSGFVTRNLLSAPLKDLDGKPLGVIQAVNKHTVPFSGDDVALIQLLAEQAGVAIQ